MDVLLLHPSRPPPEEYHATTDFDALCFDASQASFEIDLPGETHPSRRVCLPLLIGVACIRCMSTTLATMLDRLPQLSYGVAKEHHGLDFPHHDIPLSWEHSSKRPPSTLQYAAGFPLCDDEIGFDFTPGLLSEKNPYRSANVARQVLKPNPTFLALVPEPTSYIDRRLQRGVDIMYSLHEHCKQSHPGNDCWLPSDLMNWFRSCIGAPTKFPQTVLPTCGKRLIQEAKGFVSACPIVGLHQWLRAGWEPKHFAFLPTVEISSLNVTRKEKMILEIAELAGVGARFGPMEDLETGLSPEDFNVHVNSSYGVRGRPLYEAPCVKGAAARVQQEKEIASEVQKAMDEGTHTPPATEPRKATTMSLSDEEKLILRNLYDEYCGQPLARWLGVDISRLYPSMKNVDEAVDESPSMKTVEDAVDESSDEL